VQGSRLTVRSFQGIEAEQASFQLSILNLPFDSILVDKRA
jgi:hypothetical protein